MTFLPSDTPRATRLALLVDGENISADLAGQIIMKSLGFGQLVIRRVYGNAARMPKWDAAPGFRLIHAGTGKNATDLLLTVEAMSLLHDARVDALVLATSDGDFTHLAAHLRERGIAVYGMGEAKAAERFRKACSSFVELRAAEAVKALTPATPPKKNANAPLIELVAELLHSVPPEGMPITSLNAAIHKSHQIRIAASGHRTWRAFLTSHPGHFICDERGPDARVRLRKA